MIAPVPYVAGRIATQSDSLSVKTLRANATGSSRSIGSAEGRSISAMLRRFRRSAPLGPLVGAVILATSGC